MESYLTRATRSIVNRYRSLLGTSEGVWDCLGCSPEELKDYLRDIMEKSEFKPEDYGVKCVLDHAMPLRSSDGIVLYMYNFFYRNLQLMDKDENMRKGARRIVCGDGNLTTGYYKRQNWWN